MNYKPHANLHDLDVEERVHARIKGKPIQVQVYGGVVFLSGEAEDFEEKREIEEVVKSVAGVRTVVNQIRFESLENSFSGQRA